MAKDSVRIVLVASKRQLRLGLAAALLGCAAWAGSETLTLVASYPSPLGIYRSLITSGNAILARDSGRVGIRTRTPAAELDVLGSARVSSNVNAGGEIRATGAIVGEADVSGRTLTSGGEVQVGSLPSPPAAVNGKIFFNTTSGRLEFSRSNAWFPVNFPVARNVNRVVLCGAGTATTTLGTHALCMVTGRSRAAYRLQGSPDQEWLLDCASDGTSSAFTMPGQTDGAVAVECLDYVGTRIFRPAFILTPTILAP